MRPLALLLPLLALAHAANADIWRRDRTIYARGSDAIEYNQNHLFYLPDGQCSGVIEGENLLCFDDNTAKLGPPLRVYVATTADDRAPAITIYDNLDRVELRRIQPCRGKLDVYLMTACPLY